MAKRIDGNIFELNDNESVFGWFLNCYMGSDVDGKIVAIDEETLLGTMNNRNCEVDELNMISADEQNIKLYWKDEGRIIASANILLHGQSPVAFGGFRFVMNGSEKNWICFTDVQFDAIDRAKGFVYAKNQATDPEIVFLRKEHQSSIERR